MSNADNSGNNMDQSYFNVPAHKYWAIWNKPLIIVHTSFFKAWTLLLITFSSVSTAILCLTNWWQQLFILGLTWFYIQNPIIGFPTTIAGFIIAWVLFKRRSSRIKRERATSARRRRLEDAIIKQGERG